MLPYSSLFARLPKHFSPFLDLFEEDYFGGDLALPGDLQLFQSDGSDDITSDIAKKNGLAESPALPAAVEYRKALIQGFPWSSQLNWEEFLEQERHAILCFHDSNQERGLGNYLLLTLLDFRIVDLRKGARIWRIWRWYAHFWPRDLWEAHRLLLAIRREIEAGEFDAVTVEHRLRHYDEQKRSSYVIVPLPSLVYKLLRSLDQQDRNRT